MYVREFRLESLEASVAAVVDHDGDDHRAEEHHDEDAGQRALVRAARRGRGRRYVVGGAAGSAGAAAGSGRRRRHVAVVALEAGPERGQSKGVSVVTSESQRANSEKDRNFHGFSYCGVF